MKKEINYYIRLAIITLISIFLIFLFAFLTMEVEGKVNCEVTGVSFYYNGSMNNLSLNNGSINCNFEGKVPLIFILGK
ncbi:MAG: hypothetical protein PHD04_03495 [Candidatus Pacebacteria bacterium]|nr:hypothetical protein [Candidatus Paceibacterota bacterium]